MSDARAGAPRTAPVRIIRMSIEPDPPGGAADPLIIVAELDPAPDREELQWWTRQLGEHVTVRGWTGTFPGRMTTIRVAAAEDQLETVARRLLAALDEANAVYPERYAAWRREHDAQQAGERQRQERRTANRQAILDRVMNEHLAG